MGMGDEKWTTITKGITGENTGTEDNVFLINKKE